MDTFDAVPVEQGATRARQIARRVERDIIDAGWPVGTHLGSEEKLQNDWGVSRSVVRETVRILEADGVARRQRGPGGGLIITAPSVDTVLAPSSLFLDSRSVSANDLWEISLPLQATAATRLARTITEEGRVELKALLEEASYLADVDHPIDQLEIPDVPLVIARLCGNPALELFLEMTLAFSRERGLRQVNPEPARWVYKWLKSIVEAICAADPGLAEYHVRSMINRLARMRAVEDAHADAEATR
jgi:DNA-binding FadR family transcriptional regulator